MSKIGANIPFPKPPIVIASSPAFSASTVKSPAYPSQTASPVERVDAGVDG